MVRNSSDSKIGYFYIDGVRYELASVPPIRNVTNNTNSMFIGSIIAPTTNYMWTGSLCDIRIYDKALSSREVKEISKGLVLHYPLNREGFGCDNLIKNTSCFSSVNYWVNNQDVTRSVENGELKAIINQDTSTPGLKYTENLTLEPGEYTARVIAKVENGNVDIIRYPFYIANLCGNNYIKNSISNGYYKYTETFAVS